MTDTPNGIRLPSWMWHGIVLLTLGGCITWIAAWAGGELDTARKDNIAQATVLASHEWRLARLEADSARVDAKLDRVDAKLDRILERLEKP